ncbi:MAG: transposase [Gemmatimonadaceae bacterium]|nr:transposase [Gemmatimonadaceae bacterium]
MREPLVWVPNSTAAQKWSRLAPGATPGASTDEESRFREEQIAYVLRQAEGGTAVVDICRQLGVSEATIYVWRKNFAHLGTSEMRRLRQLEGKNNRLRRLVAALTLDNHMLAEALRKNG